MNKEQLETDVVIIGAGAAGLTMMQMIGHHWPGPKQKPEVIMISPSQGAKTPAPRTWCYFEAGEGIWDSVLSASWDCVRFITQDGAVIVGEVTPFNYKMLRSDIANNFVMENLSEGITVLDATADAVTEGADSVMITGQYPDGSPLRVTASWVFDSRPQGVPKTKAGVIQNFFGWFIETKKPEFFPDHGALLMDYRTEQPERGLSFGYILPMTETSALIEYTEFTHGGIDVPRYTAELTTYIEQVLGITDYKIVKSEQGVIPMISAPFDPRRGKRVFGLGMSAGATRPSSGYTFNGIQRQVAAVVAQLAAGKTPRPRVPYRKRHLMMDAIMLKALQDEQVNGPEFYARLFKGIGAREVLRFLDSRSNILHDIQLIAAAPKLPMIRAALGLLGSSPRELLN